MSFGRQVGRRARRFLQKLRTGSEMREGPDGKPLRVMGSSQVEALAEIRLMDIPPAPPGAGDTDRDDVDPVAYRVAKKARKRARRARRA